MSFVRESSFDSNWHCTNIRKGDKTVVVVIWLVVNGRLNAEENVIPECKGNL